MYETIQLLTATNYKDPETIISDNMLKNVNDPQITSEQLKKSYKKHKLAEIYLIWGLEVPRSVVKKLFEHKSLK